MNPWSKPKRPRFNTDLDGIARDYFIDYRKDRPKKRRKKNERKRMAK